MPKLDADLLDYTLCIVRLDRDGAVENFDALVRQLRDERGISRQRAINYIRHAARRLRDDYRAPGAPRKNGYAALMTVRARDKAEWDALRDEMTATERGEACREWLAKNQRCF